MRLQRGFAALGLVAIAGAALVIVAGQAVPALPGGSAPPTQRLPAATSPPTGRPADTPRPSPDIPTIGSAVSPMSSHLSGDVYGYLPYWEIDAGVEGYLDWNALTAISLFAVTQHADGSLSTTASGYPAITSERGRRIVQTARAHGVHVEIVFASFGTAENAAFFGNAAAQERTIADLRAFVRDVGAGGVNVDVEGLAGTWFGAYAAFVRDLRASLRRDDPDATVTVATNGSRSGARMAKAALDAGADRALLMGYAYRSAGSPPGAVAPLDYRGSPVRLDLVASLDLYASLGVPAGRVILGLPLFGRTWPTAGPELGAAKTGSSTAFFPADNAALLEDHAAAIRIEPAESVAWFAWQDPATGGWRQTFYDSPASLQPKFRLATERRLAGVGLWALGYDRGLPGYWDQLKSMFGPPRVVAVGLPAASATRALVVTVAAVAGSRPLVSVQLSSDGRRWSAPVALTALLDRFGEVEERATVPWTLPGSSDGRYRVFARVVDTAGTVSRPWSAWVTLDRTGPRMAGPPTVWWSSTSRQWRVRWAAARDSSGVAGYRVQVRVGTRAAVTVTDGTRALGIGLPGISRNARLRVTVSGVDALGTRGPPVSAAAP